MLFSVHVDELKATTNRLRIPRNCGLQKELN
jgi:hypothetical protein